MIKVTLPSLLASDDPAQPIPLMCAHKITSVKELREAEASWRRQVKGAGKACAVALFTVLKYYGNKEREGFRVSFKYIFGK